MVIKQLIKALYALSLLAGFGLLLAWLLLVLLNALSFGALGTAATLAHAKM